MQRWQLDDGQRKVLVAPLGRTAPAGERRGQRRPGKPAPGLLGQLADDPDEGAVLVLQPLVVGFQFCQDLPAEGKGESVRLVTGTKCPSSCSRAGDGTARGHSPSVHTAGTAPSPRATLSFS